MQMKGLCGLQYPVGQNSWLGLGPCSLFPSTWQVLQSAFGVHGLWLTSLLLIWRPIENYKTLQKWNKTQELRETKMTITKSVPTKVLLTHLIPPTIFWGNSVSLVLQKRKLKLKSKHDPTPAVSPYCLMSKPAPFPPYHMARLTLSAPKDES